MVTAIAPATRPGEAEARVSTPWAQRTRRQEGPGITNTDQGGVLDLHGVFPAKTIGSMMAHHARYEIVRQDATALTIRDVGPHDTHLTVTNDAEHVIAELTRTGVLTNEKRIFYYDSSGHTDELKHRDGVFAGFGP